MVFLKSLALSFIVSVFAAFYYSEWYCESAFGRIASGDYSGECSGMTTGLGPFVRAFVIFLPIAFLIFFIIFKLLKGKIANIAGKVTLGIFVVGLIIVLYSLGILRFPF